MMLTEENKRDILWMYREGYSVKEILNEYEGCDSKEIKDICSEEDESWSS